MKSNPSLGQRGFGIVEGLFILIMAVLICGMGFYVYQSKQTHQAWRTHQSSKGNYTLKTPNGWQVVSVDRGDGGDTLEVSSGPEGLYELRYFDTVSVDQVDLRNGLYDIEGVHERSFKTYSGLMVQEYSYKKECADNPGPTAGTCAKGELYAYDVSKGTKHVQVHVSGPSENPRTLKAIVKSVDIR